MGSMGLYRPAHPKPHAHHAEGVEREAQVEALQLGVVLGEALQVRHVGLHGRMSKPVRFECPKGAWSAAHVQTCRCGR